MASSTERSKAVGALPRPYVIATILRLLALVSLLAAVGVIAVIWLHPLYSVFRWDEKLPMSGVALAYGVAVAAVLYALALLVRYGYHTALNIHLAERRHLSRASAAGAADQARAEPALARANDEVIALLREINENTLLAEPDKGRKRARLAETRRDRMKTEVEQLIAAAKWPAARVRLEDLQADYPEDDEVRRLARQLDAAVKEHQDIDIMTTGEQIRGYMSLGLWDKARETAQRLAERYPGDNEAQKLQTVVRMEEQASDKEDRLRLYREIEHLVARKHYRDAKKVAESLVQDYPGSPEAATLRGQMDELSRNADIEVRREMENRIIEHTKLGRHREAYDVAVLLIEQYPDSPQAIALEDQIGKLRERAGVN